MDPDDTAEMLGLQHGSMIYVGKIVSEGSGSGSSTTPGAPPRRSKLPLQQKIEITFQAMGKTMTVQVAKGVTIAETMAAQGIPAEGFRWWWETMPCPMHIPCDELAGPSIKMLIKGVILLRGGYYRGSPARAALPHAARARPACTRDPAPVPPTLGM